jgi:hypothetical protein
MIMRIYFRLAVNSILAISACALLFQLLILAEILPYHIVWGGRLESLFQMRLFVSFSIIINVLILLVIAMKGAYIEMRIPEKVVNGILWGLVLLFSLNTLGNALSLSTFEALVFTPVTLVCALFCYRIVVQPAQHTD